MAQYLARGVTLANTLGIEASILRVKITREESSRRDSRVEKSLLVNLGRLEIHWF
jgi:hypothetical protein